VEGLVGYARRNFLVPLPEVNDFTELNEVLLKGCVEHGHRRMGSRGDGCTIDQRHEEERSRLLPLPERAFENEKVLRVRVSSYQTAQVDRNRYSVPTLFVGQWVWAHVSCDRVILYADQQKIAEHARLFNNSKWQIDPLHYLELIAQRVQAFDSARPIRQWRKGWSLEYEIMLKALRRRLGDNKGTRDFVRILQLHQDHPSHKVEQAVKEALDYQCYSFDGVKHLLLAKDWHGFEIQSLPPESIPGITDRDVASVDVSRYNGLLAGGAL